ncbi:HNH endonuclease signature motif containing protein [Pseudonocardia endophytica]|uniref:5-methylcytosine-specific restriction protein A n=1 Tax=Pseudonocardia endophytica TaxID=401976 RepID=A0A4R1HIE5_PSEEN|nr:HNH endonuclease signature motif containing protein [Pseudonocardia endophytica]TCK21568.1 5-methylcytosine-specific restriction protein A [Pseudonocardia endophytica]
MSSGPVADAYRLLVEAVDALEAAAGAGAVDADLLAVLPLCRGVQRRLDRISVAAASRLDRRGTFAERGYRNPTAAVMDLLGCDRGDARRITCAAEHVHPRTGLDGAELPEALPATAERFAAGAIGLEHVHVIAAVLNSGAARRIDPARLAGAERTIAEHACLYTPNELRTWATRLVEALDQDGPEPDDHPTPQVNELTITANRSGSGGRLSGRFDDAALFEAITTAVDALAAPRDGLDQRSPAERQAEALADVCSHALQHAPLPETGGRRPVISVLITLKDLQDRARAAVLDVAGAVTPESLRMLACDAGIVPVVMNGAGQPLDVGRIRRTIPDGLRRAVTARDRGCAHPGCDRPPSWCEIHHVIPWEHGGETTLGNLVMLCKMHHRQIHHADWLVRIRDGLPEFVPPRWIDPQQRPRRQPALVDVA